MLLTWHQIGAGHRCRLPIRRTNRRIGGGIPCCCTTLHGTCCCRVHASPPKTMRNVPNLFSRTVHFSAKFHRITIDSTMYAFRRIVVRLPVTNTGANVHNALTATTEYDSFNLKHAHTCKHRTHTQPIRCTHTLTHTLCPYST